MDWTRAYEQLLAGSPLAINAVLLATAWMTRKGVLASVGRFGARLGRLEQRAVLAEQQAHIERMRRWQIEVVLLEDGVKLPAWPDLTDVVPTPLLSRHSERSSR